ncbi:MAG: hypothetical protein H0W61_00480 [Bacteroidetes bacterium]|nr:hypothetical protein [Bacteroidota bacterium]
MENGTSIVKKTPAYKKIFKFFLWACISFLLLIIAGISLVFIYEDEVKGVIIKELNKHLATEVRIDPKNIDLTFISSFPKCAIEFKNLLAMETSKIKDKDTLIFAESLSLEFSLKDIFNKKYDIKQVKLVNAKCFPEISKSGVANYEVWKTKGVSSDKASDSLSFKLEDISLKNVSVNFKNRKEKIKAEFAISDLTFKGDFSEMNYAMKAEGKINIHAVTSGKTSFFKSKKLNLDVELDVAGDRYTLKKTDISLNEMVFGLTGTFFYKDSLENLHLDYKAKNLDIEAVLSLLPETYKSRIGDYKSSGEFFVNGNCSYNAGKALALKTNFGVKKATIEYTPKNTKLTNVIIGGELLINESRSFIRLDDFTATLNNDKISGKFYLENFKEPFVEVTAGGAFDLQNLNSFWPVDTLEKLEGNLKFEGSVKGLLKDMKENAFSEKMTLDIILEVQKLKARFKGDEHDVGVESCKITAHQRDIRVNDFKLIKGSSEINLEGEIPGMFNYLLDNKAPLVIKGVLESKNLKMEDFIFKGGNSAGENSEFNIPANVNLLLDASIAHFSFGKFEASNIKGNFELKKQKAMVSDMKLETMEGEAVINAYADASGKELEVTMEAGLTKMNVKKMFIQLNNFGQTTLLDKNINGLITAAIDFSGNWDKKLQPVLNSIEATADFTIERGELIDFKPLESLARFVELQELKRIKFSTLSSNIEIKKSIIYIPQTTIKNSVLNLDFNGTHSFNNDVDYHIRLLISELLSKKRKADNEFGPVENDPDNRRSAFILMTGNIDNPVIKYDRKGLKQKVKEDLKQEKQNLKKLLKEEFGAFKKDTLTQKPGNKADQKFELEKQNNNSTKKALELKKKKDDDDDF